MVGCAGGEGREGGRMRWWSGEWEAVGPGFLSFWKSGLLFCNLDQGEKVERKDGIGCG